MNPYSTHLPGDIVKIAWGAFEGELAQVISVPPLQHVVVVELIHSTVPLPVTISVDGVNPRDEPQATRFTNRFRHC